MLNNATIQGNLVRDVEIKNIGDKGTALATYTIACTNGKGQYENTVFMDCKSWGKNAEFVKNYFEKGSQMIATGSLEQESWEKDGQKRSKLVLSVMKADFCGGKAKPKSEVASAPIAPDEIPF